MKAKTSSSPPLIGQDVWWFTIRLACAAMSEESLPGLITIASVAQDIKIDELLLKDHLDAKAARALATMDISTVGQLLRHYPRRYLERGAFTPLNKVEVGADVTVVSRVISARVVSTRAGRTTLLNVIIGDDTGQLKLTFFAGKPQIAHFMATKLSPGTIGLFAGTVKEGWKGTGPLELTHPDWEALPQWSSLDDAMTESNLIMPIYPATAKVRSWKIRDAIREVLDGVEREMVPDPLPAKVRQREGFMTEFEALKAVHDPASKSQLQRALDSVKLTEAFTLQVALMRRRFDREAYPAHQLAITNGPILGAIDQALPFTLTKGQRDVGRDIAADIARDAPMVRMLQGDVGSGKTVVALRAIAQTLDSGAQAALLAPTEVLAQQHAENFRALLAQAPPVNPAPPVNQVPPVEANQSALALPENSGADALALLTASTPAHERARILQDLKEGKPRIVVGTHALLEDTVQFANLGLAVIDEQQRFGVEQRDKLRANYKIVPHQLFMTATPIPRTLMLTTFGDVAVSSLTERPAGRSEVVSYVVEIEKRNWVDRMFQVTAQRIKAGGRVFVVVPRIDAASPGAEYEPEPQEVEAGPSQLSINAATTPSVESAGELLRSHPAFEGIAIARMHGRLTAEEKTHVMADFAAGKTPVLVSTTVIEVGVDVREADVMIIMGAELFGLSQLHQLRGRIGRGERPGVCFFVTLKGAPAEGVTKLEELSKTTNGFEIAELDLELRKSGDILGTSQHGLNSQIKILNLVTDKKIIAKARDLAIEILSKDPQLQKFPKVHQALAALHSSHMEESLNRV